MNAKNVHYGLVGLLVVLGIGLGASVYKANGLLEYSSKTLASLKADDQGLSAQKVELAGDKKDIITYGQLNAIAKSVVPQDKDQAEAVREIVNLAGRSGIKQLSSITFAASTLGGTKVKTAAGLTQVTPVKGIPGVYDLQITVQQAPTDSVSYDNLIAFLSKLEQNRRTAQVSSITIQPDTKNPGNIAFTLVIDEFIKP